MTKKFVGIKPKYSLYKLTLNDYLSTIKVKTD